jgi:hypothetical protein
MLEEVQKSSAKVGHLEAKLSQIEERFYTKGKITTIVASKTPPGTSKDNREDKFDFDSFATKFTAHFSDVKNSTGVNELRALLKQLNTAPVSNFTSSKKMAQAKHN